MSANKLRFVICSSQRKIRLIIAHVLSIEHADSKCLAHLEFASVVCFFGLAEGWLYAPTDSLVFEQVAGDPVQIDGLNIDPGRTLVFREGEDGKISYAMISLQNVAAERLSWFEGGEGNNQLGCGGIKGGGVGRSTEKNFVGARKCQGGVRSGGTF